MVNYGNAIKRPFTDFGKLVIGILLSILPIINWFVSGYALECARSASKKKYELPAWTNFGKLFVQGLLASVIGLIYALPAIILLLIGAMGIVAGLFSATAGNMESILPMLLTAGPIVLIAMVLLVLTAYITPVATINYAMHNKFAKGFDIKVIFKKAFTVTYLVGWLVAMVYMFVLYGVLSIIPGVGTLLVSFIAAVTSYTIFGEVYSSIKG